MSIKKAFTLVELLIVILIISLSYGIIYNVALKEKNTQNLNDYQKIISNIKSHIDYKSKRLWLFCNEDNECYVGTLNGDNLENYVEFEIETPLLSYYLTLDEELKVIDFNNIKVGNFSFKPQIAIKASSNGVIQNNFLSYDDKWYYYSFYENKYKDFISPTEAIYYAKKREYLPFIAGDENDN